MEAQQADDNIPIIVRLVNVEEMARILGVPTSWLYERTRLNTIPYVRVGKYVRFRPDELLASFQTTKRFDEVK